MVTKRQLGIGLVVLSVLAVLGVVAVDFFGAGRWSGFGPLQWIGFGLGLFAIAVGAVLISLGDRLA